MPAGHNVAAAKMDCALTPSDAHVISGSEDGAFPDVQTNASSPFLGECHTFLALFPCLLH